MSLLSEDLDGALADLTDLGGAESAAWLIGGNGVPVPVNVVMRELPDSIAQEFADTTKVRLIDCLVSLTQIPDPKRGDSVSFGPTSIYSGEWSVLGCEQRGPAHRTMRLRQSLIEAARDPAVQQVLR